jgi:hypothetical protein
MMELCKFIEVSCGVLFSITRFIPTTIRGLDFTPVDDTHLPPETPIIVVMHGLTGGMQYFYNTLHSLNLITKP